MYCQTSTSKVIWLESYLMEQKHSQSESVVVPRPLNLMAMTAKYNLEIHGHWPVRQAWMKNSFGFPRRVSQWRSSKYSTMSRMRTGLASLVYNTPSLPCVRKQQTNASKLEWSRLDEVSSSFSRVSIVKSLWTSTSNFRSSNSCFSVSVKSQIHTEKPLKVTYLTWHLLSRQQTHSLGRLLNVNH